jgi:hypothetical protein
MSKKSLASAATCIEVTDAALEGVTGGQSVDEPVEETPPIPERRPQTDQGLPAPTGDGFPQRPTLKGLWDRFWNPPTDRDPPHSGTR